MPGFEAFSPAALAWIVGVLAFAGLVHGALGMGFPTIATPLITLVTFAGIRIRNRVDADTYRRWLRQALFAIAVFLLLQYVYVAVAER